MATCRRILVAFDDSQTSRRALAEAIALAADQHAALGVLHIVDTQPPYLGYAPAAEVPAAHDRIMAAGRQIAAQACAAACRAEVPVEPLVRELGTARVAEHVVAEARRWRAELIVMGTHGRRGLNRLALGSDAERVARTTPLPLLLVRTPAD